MALVYSNWMSNRESYCMCRGKNYDRDVYCRGSIYGYYQNVRPLLDKWCMCLLFILLRLHKSYSANDALSHKMDPRNLCCVWWRKDSLDSRTHSLTPAYASEEILIKKTRKVDKKTNPTNIKYLAVFLDHPLIPE